MKPYDGGAWKGVSRLDDESALRQAYEKSGTFLMHLQQSVDGFDRFVRCIGLGPQFLLVRYDPGAPLHDRYQIDHSFVDDDERQLLEDMGMTINSFFGWISTRVNRCTGMGPGTQSTLPTPVPIRKSPHCTTTFPGL